MTTKQMHTYCAMCTSHCSVVATVEDGIFKQVNADPKHPNGCICVKGTAAPEVVYSPDRLQYPMKPLIRSEVQFHIAPSCAASGRRTVQPNEEQRRLISGIWR